MKQYSFGKDIYGKEVSVDIYGCDLKKISSKKEIQRYVDTLVRRIKMKKYGKTLIPYFGRNNILTKGYSLVQLIETSSITGHFSDYKRSAYINIFSCAPFDAKRAALFTKRFFGAKAMTVRTSLRK